MQSRRLGASDISVTTIGLGAAPLGNLFAPVSDAAATATVRRAWQAGIRYVDTAPHYGLGLSERRVGMGLRTLPGAMTLSTKVGRLLRPNPAGTAAGTDQAHGFAVPADRLRVWDLSADGIRRSLHESLDRLGIDHVEAALLHDPDEFEAQATEVALPALLRLRDQGFIGAVGAGMNQSAMLTRFVNRFDLDVVLVAARYTLLDQSALDDLLPAALARGTSVVAAGVFGSGLLAADYPGDKATYEYVAAPAALLARARAIAAVCREHGSCLPGAALHFPLAHPAIVCALLGMRSPIEVDRNVRLLHDVPPPGLWRELQRRNLLRLDVVV